MRQRWGRSIRRQRKFLGMTQLELARAVNMTQHAVSQWEAGRRAPDVETQLAIARALKIDARVLFAYPDAA